MVSALQERLGVWPGERATQFFSLTVDASLSELLLLVTGATLFPVPRALRSGGRDLVRWMQQERITLATFTPSFWSQVPVEPGDLPDLRLLILGGESCPPALVARIWRPGLTICNAYGLTEATVCSSLSVCVPGQPVTIGHPLRGMTMTVRDARLCVLPTGVSGQLCLAGPGLARGYTGAALTAELFVPAPDTHERLLLTRDRAVQQEDGSLVVLGRLEEERQVNVRGKLVDLEEIEGLLRCHDLVRECAVVADAGGRIIAYITLRPGVTLGEAAVGDRLEGALTTRLMDSLLPRAYVVLPVLPRTRHEKLERDRLLRETPVTWRRSPTFRPAETVVERGIAGIVAGMLTAQARQRAALRRLLGATEDAAAPQDEPGIGWEQVNLAVPATEQAGERLESLDAPAFALRLTDLFGVEVATTELFVPLVLVAQAIEHRLAERRRTQVGEGVEP